MEKYLPMYLLHNCFINNSFDFNDYSQYRKREYEEVEEYSNFCSNILIVLTSFINISKVNYSLPKKKKRIISRLAKRDKLMQCGICCI